MKRVESQRAPIEENSGGSRLWSGIDELSGDPAFHAWVAAEYPAAAELAPTARRQFLKLMGASFALAGLAGCEKSPFVAALPYVNQPENEAVGVPRYYATAVTFEGYAQPVIATTYSGRPIKLDGNPDHPVTKGRSDAFMQAAILGLYDPDRAQGPSRHGEPVTWNDVVASINTLRTGWTANEGEGLRVLMSPTSSPTLLRQLDALRKQFPKMRIHLHDVAGETARRKLTSAAYGQPLDLHYVLDECDVVVSFDDDFLGPGPNQIRNARGWAASRRRSSGRPSISLRAAESVPSATGAVASASARLIANASRMAALAAALANRLGIDGAAAGELTPTELSWVEKAAKTCSAAQGRALVASGPFGDAGTAIWVARINDALKSLGRALRLSQPITGPAEAGSLRDLIGDMRAGKVKTLLILDCNPAYTAPGGLGFRDALKQVQSTLHLGLQRDETGELCEWQLALAHMLESWSDARAVDGTASIIQPTITPFYDVRGVHQIMAMLLGEIDPAADAAVRETWTMSFGADFDARWRQALHDGFVEGVAAGADVTTPSTVEPSAETPGEGLDIVFRPDPTIWDGTFSNIGWLQELPK
ncbi:MAG: TAT-variant-translocated molybdopterin oxidoreductase, partial [Bradyrhizobium sp.]|uniref:TAT-variant-translocated molybdopterin oxidoreductase n=1 Tax=Bradyrhizobium sp. TaxID=376 RepID=UPI001D930D28